MILSVPSLVTLSVVAGIVLKITLVLAAAFGVAALRRGGSAATRHFIWLLALSGSLAIVFLTPIAPRLSIDLPAARGDSISGASASLTAPATRERRRGDTRTESDAAPGSAPIGAARRPLPMRSAGDYLIAAGAIWLMGALAVALWCVVGHLGVSRLGRRARAASARDLAAIDPSRRAPHRNAWIGFSPSVGSPVTWGWRRPVILLPTDAERWPAERLRAALLHEMAHIERRDYLAQLLACAACALLWFHPLVWSAARRLRMESEHACDDRVLAQGTAGAEYAEHLLAVARGARRFEPGGLVAVSMARSSHLEGRLLAVLDDARPRGPLSRRAAVAIAALMAVGLVPFSGLRPGEAEARSHDHEKGGVPSFEHHSAHDWKEVDADSVVLRIVPAPPNGVLDLDLDTGGEIEIRGWDRSQVSVRAFLSGRDWRHTRVRIDPARDGVHVRSEFDRWGGSQSTSHAFEIQVPRRYDVRVRSAGGGVSITDVEGTFRGHTGGGSITLDHLKGEARLTTGGGDIEVTDSRLDGAVMTGGGSVHLSRVLGKLRGSSGSGPVIYADPDVSSEGGEEAGDLSGVDVDPDHERITLDHDRRVGRLHIEKAGGNVDLAEAPHGATISTGGGDIHVGRSGGAISAQTGGGDIEVGPASGSVSAGTGGGTVRVTLAPASGRDQDVDIRAGGGRVIVELPPSWEGRFELETAYTRSHGRATRIESAWNLARESTTDWDGREGTPRRYVRAHGTVGNGAHRVRVHTVNDDIEIRRGRD
jgi:beta-lactamase regulating signal transducer with metallopeptidase domain